MIAGVHDFALFVVAGLLLNLTPGPDLLITTLRASTSGFRAGAVTALGISAGCLVHVALGALGISALLMMSATAFQWLKWAGAAYLVFLGARMLLSARPAEGPDQPRPPSIPMRTMFIQGAMTNLFNPKVALFFLAFVPQFIDADSSSFSLAFAALGVVFIVNGTLVSVAFAALAARAGRRLRGNRHFVWLNRIMGATFVALGIRLALAEKS